MLVAQVNNDVALEANVGSGNLVSQELERQLATWRLLLPARLQWLDEETHDMLHLDQTAVSLRRSLSLIGLDAGNITNDQISDVGVLPIQLRSQYYSTRFQILRPYIYKALHTPDLLTDDDSSKVALAVQSACFLASIVMSFRNKKRHLPHHFLWTQNAMSVFLVLSMVAESRALLRITAVHVDTVLLKHIRSCLLDWTIDMRQADGIAEWGCPLLQSLEAHS